MPDHELLDEVMEALEALERSGSPIRALLSSLQAPGLRHPGGIAMPSGDSEP